MPQRPMVSSAAILSILLASLGCARDTKEAIGREPPEKAHALPESTEKATHETTSPQAGTTPQAAAKEPNVPEAIRDLVATPRATPKSQPSPSTEAAAPVVSDLKSLQTQSEKIAVELVDALAKADLPRAEKLLLTADDLVVVLSPGLRDILRGTLPAENEATLRRLFDSLKGKELKYEWKPGEVVTGSDRTFKEPFPIMRGGALHIIAEGVPIKVDINQLVYFRQSWRIFMLSTP